MIFSKKKPKFKFNPIFLSKFNNFVIAAILVTFGFLFLTAVVIEESKKDLYNVLKDKAVSINLELYAAVEPTNIIFKYLNKKISQEPNISNQRILNLMHEFYSAQDLQQENSTFADLFWVDRNNKLVLSARKGILDKPSSFNLEENLDSVRSSSNKAYISNYQKNAVTGADLTIIAEQVMDLRGNYSGMLVIGIDNEQLKNALKELKEDKGIIFAVVNNKNELILSNFTKDSAEFRKQIHQFNNLEKGSIGLQEPLTLDDKQLYYAKTLPDFGLQLFVGYEKDKIGTIARDTFAETFMLYIASLAAVVVFINFLHTNLSRVFSGFFYRDFREKMNLIKFSDRAKDSVGLDIQRSLQMELIDNVSIRLNKTNMNHVISEAILISTKDSLAKNINLLHKASAYKEEILCDTLRIKQVFISLMKILISIIPENKSIEITSYYEGNKYLVQFAVSNIDITSLDKIMSNVSFQDEGINSLIYLDFNQIEYFLKLHGGSMILDIEKNEKINFILSIPAEDGTDAPKVKTVADNMGSNVVSLSKHRSNKNPQN